MSDDTDFEDPQVGATEEVTFNVAHQDEFGVIHFDVLRTTISADQVIAKRDQIRAASRAYYEGIGHTFLYAQMQVESLRLMKGAKPRPKLKLIKGGLMSAVFAVSSAVSSGNTEIDGWLSEAEMATEVASFDRRHPGAVRLGSMMSSDSSSYTATEHDEVGLALTGT